MPDDVVVVGFATTFAFGCGEKSIVEDEMVMGCWVSSDDGNLQYYMSLCHQDAQLLGSNFEDHIGPQVLSALNLQQD
ncbi:hypothetical protein Pyn_31896 [Prunus yedoensis var. nudiflora]|uniref:Uncharacterized protein n=1 Tax=Prunus yedoensis var. nudiflora TaxID=2094558 RepID=A0A314Z4K6_PRUYE|nr:hypothetical protein Pyn_31896 [Prunus yedoensis var. nudiflora]